MLVIWHQSLELINSTILLKIFSPTRNKLIFEPAFTTAPYNPSAAIINAITS